MAVLKYNGMINTGKIMRVYDNDESNLKNEEGGGGVISSGTDTIYFIWKCPNLSSTFSEAASNLLSTDIASNIAKKILDSSIKVIIAGSCATGVVGVYLVYPYLYSRRPFFTTIGKLVASNIGPT